MPFPFALNINNKNRDLSPENGLDIAELGQLIQRLKAAIDAGDGSKAVLYGVSNHGYTPNIITSSEQTYSNFANVHINIYEKGLGDLNTPEAKYAKKLKQILGEDGYVEALDKDNQPICKIYSSDIEKVVPFYYAITNQSGIISEIGAVNLEERSHIYLHGGDYRIYISAEQDSQLKHYYRDASTVIDFKLKQKRSISTGSIISATLISYKVKSLSRLYDALNSIDKNDITFLGEDGTISI